MDGFRDPQALLAAPPMSRTVLLYNLLMGAVDAMALVALSRQRSTRAWLVVGGAAGILAAILALALGERDHFVFVTAGKGLLGAVSALALGAKAFGVARLAACGIFIHGSLLLGASAILLGKAARTATIISATGMIVLLGIAVDAFWIEPTWLEVTHLRLTSPKLTERVRIVVLADLQAETFGPYEREVLDRVMQEKPDLILLAGDYTQTDRQSRPSLRREVNAYLRELRLYAHLGVYAVDGNVDDPDWAAMFERLPVTVIRHQNSFPLGPIRLTCLTLAQSYRANLKLDDPEPGLYHVVVGHSPDYAQGTIDADLLVAGHTHGGQVRLPWLGPVALNCSVPRRMACGLTRLESGAWLVVSRGTGMERGSAPRLRFLCRPELVVIDLEPESADP